MCTARPAGSGYSRGARTTSPSRFPIPAPASSSSSGSPTRCCTGRRSRAQRRANQNRPSARDGFRAALVAAPAREGAQTDARPSARGSLGIVGVRRRATGTDAYAANGLNQYADVGGETPVYDASGNLTLDHKGRSFAYTAENVLKSATVSSATYDYELYADNLRSNIFRPGHGQQAFFYYDGDQEIAEYAGDNATLRRRYIRLPGSVDEGAAEPIGSHPKRPDPPHLMIDYALSGGCASG